MRISPSIMRLFLVLSVVVSLAVGELNYRLCPNNYHYAGDDDYLVNATARWGIPIDESPIYSCYRIYKNEKDSDFLSANQKCWDDEGQLLSLDTEAEALRLRTHFLDDSSHDDYDILEDLPMLTSGMIIEGQWYWLGANASVDEDELLTGDLSKGQCLTLTMTSDGQSLIASTNCFQFSGPFVCETRVRTVTYMAWFASNWLTVIMIFLLIVMMITLCYACASPTARRRERVVHRRPDLDLPPSYEKTVNPSQPSRMERYKEKGREIAAKIVIFRHNDNASETQQQQNTQA